MQKNNTLIQCMKILLIPLFLSTLATANNTHSTSLVEVKKEATQIAQANFTVKKKIHAKLYKKHSKQTTKIKRIHSTKRKIRHTLPSNYQKFGRASWYGRDFHGRKTANGERFNMHAMTAAHKTLPMNTMLLVKNLDTGKKTVVRINDRGPFVHNRIIDLSYAAAKKIGMIPYGTANVAIKIIPHKNYIAQQETKEPTSPTISVLTSTASETPLGDNRSDLIMPKHKGQKQQPKEEFFAQIATFHDKERAIELKKRFVKAGHRIIINSKKADGEDTIYRVLVFVGNTLENAEKFEEILLASGYNNAFLLPKCKKKIAEQ